MRPLVLAAVLGVGCVAPALAQSREDVDQTERRLELADGSVPCFPVFSGEAEVHVLSRSGGMPTVVVEPTDKPALVVVTSSNPILWRFDIKPGAWLVGVLFLGYDKPSGWGLPDDVPLGRYYYRSGDEPTCGRKGQDQIKSQEEAIREAEFQLRNLENELEYRTIIVREYAALQRRLKASIGDEKDLAIANEIIRTAEAKHADIASAIPPARAALSNARTEKSPPRNLHFEPLFDNSIMATALELDTFEKALLAYGDYKVVSFSKTNDGVSPFVVSSTTANTFRLAQEDARRQLKALVPPVLPLKPADAPRLAAPDNVVATDGLNWLEAQGYLMKGGPYLEYACAYRNYQTRAVGVPLTVHDCPHGTRAYTILGPVVLPPGLAGARSATLFLPAGVPPPEGPIGHSDLVGPAELQSLPTHYYE